MRVNLYKISLLVFGIITILILAATVLIVQRSKDSKELNSISISSTLPTPTLTITVDNVDVILNENDIAIYNNLSGIDSELVNIDSIDTTEDSKTL